MKHFFTIFLIIFLLTSCYKAKKEDSQNQLTWTYTYLKATEGRTSELKEFLIKNWLVMDSIAVKKQLFKNYELIENLDKSENSEWHFMVAVEYFTENTYAAISKEFNTIRENHQTVKIKGSSLSELGRIVKSEVVKKSY